jgi:hypothetical protein
MRAYHICEHGCPDIPKAWSHKPGRWLQVNTDALQEQMPEAVSEAPFSEGGLMYARPHGGYCWEVHLLKARSSVVV